MNQLKKKLAEVAGRVGELVGRIPARRVELGISGAVTLLALVVYAFVATGTRGTFFLFLQNVEQRSLDAMFKSRGPRPVDDHIVIVAIDDNTLLKVGAWPIPRNGYAKLVDRLHQGGARVVAFDVNFPVPEKNSAADALGKLEVALGPKLSPEILEKIRQIEKTSDNDVILAKSIQDAGNVILGHSFLDPEAIRHMDPKAMEAYEAVLWAHPFPDVEKPKGFTREFDLGRAWQVAGGQTASGVLPNLSLLIEDDQKNRVARSVGFYDVTPDGDGTVRNATLLIRFQDKDWYPSLALEALRVYENIKDQASVAYMVDTGLDHLEVGPHNIRTRADGTVMVNFAGPYRSYPQYSMGDVLDGAIPAASFKDKIVFVGATAKGIGDLRSTPFQKQDQGYMGVETHANVLDNLLHSDERGRGFIRRGMMEEILDVVFILLFGLGMGWVFGHVKPWQATAAVVGALLLYLGFARFSFTHFGMWLFVVVPAAALVVDYGAIVSYRMIFEEREKRRVRRMFARYVSPDVISLMEQNPEKYAKAGGETKELTVMFSDIRSFSTISEGLTADELVALLNEYLGEMTGSLYEYWGTLDKYIGDAVMAFWGSPLPQEDHALRACTTALDMIERLQRLNRKWAASGRQTLEIGIGINTGLMSVGNMGSEHRFGWSVMGDNVNLASRLEGQNKEYHTTCIISELTWNQIQGAYLCRPLDRIRVQGKLKPVGIYELMAYLKDAVNYADLLQRWSKAQEAYYRQAWDEAIQHYESLLALYPDDGPSHTFLKRSHEYRKEAPVAGWDGVYVAKTK